MPALLLGRCTRLHPATLPVATTVLLWASAFPGIRAALQGFSPAGLASLRFTIAAVVLLIASLAIRPHWPRGRDLVRVALAGLDLHELAADHPVAAVALGLDGRALRLKPETTVALPFGADPSSRNSPMR